MFSERDQDRYGLDWKGLPQDLADYPMSGKEYTSSGTFSSAGSEARHAARRREESAAQSETLIIDYRSPPSGLGTLEKSNIVIQFDGASPALRNKKTSHFNSELETAEAFEELAQWLKTNHNVTHVRDTEMEFDEPPSSGKLYMLDEWIRNLGW